MADIELDTDPASYISGPTGVGRGNGGTNQEGGVTVTDPDDDVQTTQTAAAQPVGESTPAPAPAQGGQPGQ
jgi:hypothetical protein